MPYIYEEFPLKSDDAANKLADLLEDTFDSEFSVIDGVDMQNKPTIFLQSDEMDFENEHVYHFIKGFLECYDWLKRIFGTK